MNNDDDEEKSGDSMDELDDGAWRDAALEHQRHVRSLAVEAARVAGYELEPISGYEDTFLQKRPTASSSSGSRPPSSGTISIVRLVAVGADLPTDTPQEPRRQIIGKLAYQGERSVQVQCFNCHGVCAKWINMKDVSGEGALIAWVLAQRDYATPQLHKAAFNRIVSEWRP